MNTKTIDVLIALALLIGGLPFYFTRDIQEDAFITWRCAVHLADAGVYSFNTKTEDMAVTSHAYALFVALIRVVSGPLFIPLTLMVMALAMIAAMYLLAQALASSDYERRVLWVLLAMMPITLHTAYSGMETPLFILAVVTAAVSLTREHISAATYVALGVMPWIRPDAVAAGLILLSVYALYRRTLPIWPAVSLVLGACTVAVFNHALTGSFVNHTVNAKLVAYAPDHSIASTAARLFKLLVSDSIFAPLDSKYLWWSKWIFSVAIAACWTVVLKRCIAERRTAILLVSVALLAFIIPICFAVGGVIFPWYLWPSSLFGFVAPVWLLSKWMVAAESRARLALVTGVVLALACGQLVLCASHGAREVLTRQNIGLFIKDHSVVSDTVFLEPAGYIPFFSERPTCDELGLGCRKVMDYRIKYARSWWMEFVRREKPTFLVERDHFKDSMTYEGERLSSEDMTWLNDHYQLVQTVLWSPNEFASSAWKQMFLKAGSSATYYIYRRVR